MKIIQLCDDCRMQHTVDFDPVVGYGAAMSNWLTKHAGHRTRFEQPARSRKPQRPFRLQAKHDKTVPWWVRQLPDCKPTLWQGEVREYGHDWLTYLHNADVQTAYAASASPTITLASLAASSTLLAGQESSAVDNGATNKYLDYLSAGHFKTAASNAQVGVIQVAVVAAEDDTPTWQDVFDGTNSTETVSLQQVYDQICKILASIVTTATNALTWPYGKTAISGLFGGAVPDQFVYFVSHSAETTTNAWSATEGDHTIKHEGVYATVT